MNPKYQLLLGELNENLTAKGLSTRTIPDYLHNVEIFLNYLEEIGITEIEEVDRRIMADYQVKLLDHTYRGKPIGAKAKTRRLSTVKGFFQYLIKTGVVISDPTIDVELPKTSKYLPRNILTKKEVGKLLEVPNLNTPLGIRDRAILEVFYSTGIRVSELCNLALNDVDIVRGELRVNQGKNAKDRIVPLGEVACDYLELYLKKSRPKLAPQPNQNTLFVSKNGRKIHYTNLCLFISRYAQKAGIKKKISTHNLRHTCATHLLQGKADIRHIQEILGHRSLATTQIYTKVEIADLKKVHRQSHPREKREVPVNDGWY